MRVDKSPLPVFAGLIGIALLSIMDAVIKDLRSDLATPQMVFLRYAMGIIAAAPLFPYILKHRPTGQSFRANGIRAVFILVTAGLFFFAIGRLQLVYAVALAFTTPIWIAVLSSLILKEPVTKRSGAAIIIGFSGVLVMIFGPHIGSGTELTPPDPTGVAAVIGASVTYAIVAILTRKQAAHDPVPVLVGLQSAFAFLLIIPVGVATWEPIETGFWPWLALIGILGTYGHLFLTYAFSNAPVGRIAPVEYSGFLWAGALGYLFFAEIPTASALLGSLLIIAGCLIVILERPG